MKVNLLNLLRITRSNVCSPIQCGLNAAILGQPSPPRHLTSSRCLLSTKNKTPIPEVPAATPSKRFNLKGVHEPEYLDMLKPQIPFYPLLNIQIRGYDYAVLDNYARYLHRLANKLGLKVSKYWCTPNTAAKVETLKHESNVVEHTYELNTYERNVQIENISSRVAAQLVDIVHRSLPTGVQLSIHEHNHIEHEVPRYIPDLELAQYQEELKLLKTQTDFAEEPKR